MQFSPQSMNSRYPFPFQITDLRNHLDANIVSLRLSLEGNQTNLQLRFNSAEGEEAAAVPEEAARPVGRFFSRHHRAGAAGRVPLQHVHARPADGEGQGHLPLQGRAQRARELLRGRVLGRGEGRPVWSLFVVCGGPNGMFRFRRQNGNTCV